MDTQPTFGDFTEETLGQSNKTKVTFLPKSDEGDTKPCIQENMGPIGPYATGRVDWGDLSGLTGTRPVVDSYSITRYSNAEWKKHNKDIFCGASNDQHRANLVELNSRQAMESIAAAADKTQHANTLRLGQRAREIHRWKTELERAIEEMIQELDLLEQQRRRAEQAKAVLGIVKNIASECLNRRTTRMEPDLVRDTAEEELIKEAALVKEIEDLINRTLVQIEEQLERNKSAKARLEDDWSDKKESHQIESINVNLNNKSKTILFKPGATRFPDGQSTPSGWEENVRDVLQTAEAVKGQSCELRALLDGPIFSDCVKDLRAQADKVDTALAKKIAQTDLCLQALENELQVVVRRIAEIENLIQELKDSIRGLDFSMKVAQTRLDNRLHRPRIENCRDESQFGLVDEVKSLAEQASVLQGQLKQAEDNLVNLYTARGDLEREIQIKRKSLYVDKERCQVVRLHYPSSTALAGH
uniref:Tektin n=1 Tax=Clastoptera arizonana TaxID=38151 RepID=A0A1B6BY47_9HEMI